LVFDRQGVRDVDRAAIHEYGIPGVVLMENAARGLAEQALDMLSTRADAAPLVLIICGSGNNGGDGYALARHLHKHRIEVVIAPLGEPQPQSDAGINRAICRKMRLREIAIDQLDELASSTRIALIVDAIFGTGLDRPISGQAAEVIEWINAQKRPVLAADVPSGMDCNSGGVLGGAVRASRTVTFVGWKTGFFGLEAQKLLGEVFVADIGAPVELLERFGRLMEQLSHHEAPEHEADMRQQLNPRRAD
jgi:NAD(P)H-hydrate epimerase